MSRGHTAQTTAQAAFLVCAFALAAPLALPLSAHHSFAAEFDSSRIVHLRGSLTGLEWSNPHSHFYIDVPDGKGNVVNWACEAGGPGILMRMGLRKSDFKIGEVLTIEGYPAKDGSHRVDARRLTLPDGRGIDRLPSAQLQSMGFHDGSGS